MSNQFTAAGLNRAATYGFTSTGFPYAAVGTGSATFAAGLAAMGTELFRQAIDSAPAAGEFSPAPGAWRPTGYARSANVLVRGPECDSSRPCFCSPP